MYEWAITIFSANSFMSTISTNMDVVAGIFDNYLNGTGNLRIVSIILMMLALILFLFLIIILYVKSLTSFLKSEQDNSNDDDKNSRTFFETMEDDEEYAENVKLREEELEKELQKDLEKALAEKAIKDAAIKRQEIEQAKERETKPFEKRNFAPKEIVLDFDWKKGKLADYEKTASEIEVPVMQYKQSQKKLNDLLGLVIDMLGRNVDDLKIAQTIIYRNMNLNSEEEIMQTVDAVKDFIALCLNRKFDPLKKSRPLPDEGQALYNLANGDTSPALSLIEALMDDNIDKASTMMPGKKRDEIFATTSNYAAMFGALAALSDIHLATGAYELAIELYPQNINAWSHIGDMYYQTDIKNKAVKAYENVLSLSDEEIHQRQIANANKMLSKYYYEHGDSINAAKLHNLSKGYYDSIGINRRLDRQEVEIVDIIESHQKEEIENTITKILANQNLRQYSFA